MPPQRTRTIELFDLDPALKDFVTDCEVTGRRTLFTRGGKPVAVITSYDEYLALTETISIGQSPDAVRDIGVAEEEAKRGALLLMEDLLVE